LCAFSWRTHLGLRPFWFPVIDAHNRALGPAIVGAVSRKCLHGLASSEAPRGQVDIRGKAGRSFGCAAGFAHLIRIRIRIDEKLTDG